MKTSQQKVCEIYVICGLSIIFGFLGKAGRFTYAGK